MSNDAATTPERPAATDDAAPAPRSWLNWRAVRAGTVPSQTVEMRLYSNAWFVAEARGFGPYSFLNPVPSTRRGAMYELKSGVVLRAGVALPPDARVPLVTSDDH